MSCLTNNLIRAYLHLNARHDSVGGLLKCCQVVKKYGKNNLQMFFLIYPSNEQDFFLKVRKNYLI